VVAIGGFGVPAEPPIIEEKAESTKPPNKMRAVSEAAPEFIIAVALSLPELEGDAAESATRAAVRTIAADPLTRNENRASVATVVRPQVTSPCIRPMPGRGLADSLAATQPPISRDQKAVKRYQAIAQAERADIEAIRKAMKKPNAANNNSVAKATNVPLNTAGQEIGFTISTADVIVSACGPRNRRICSGSCFLNSSGIQQPSSEVDGSSVKRFPILPAPCNAVVRKDPAAAALHGFARWVLETRLPAESRALNKSTPAQP